MGNHVKARPRAKPKPKSVKAKINRKMGSKRRTQKMGKELKKGMKGAAASYLTRAQVCDVGVRRQTSIDMFCKCPL